MRTPNPVLKLIQFSRNMPNTKPPKPKKKKTQKAKTPVPGSSNHVFQESNDKEDGGRHDLGNISSNNSNNNSNNVTNSELTKSGKDTLNITNSDSETETDSLYADEPCPCNKSNSDSWKLLCTKCNQVWHSSCANL